MSKFKLIKHKYGAKRCKRNEISFPSKLERSCYDELQSLKAGGRIRFFLRQVPFDLPGGVKHVVDFFVFTDDDAFLIEAKGRDLPVGRLKREQVEDIYQIKINVATRPVDVLDILFPRPKIILCKIK